MRSTASARSTPLTGEVKRVCWTMWPSIRPPTISCRPGTRWQVRLQDIEREMDERVAFFEAEGQAHRSPADRAAHAATTWRCCGRSAFAAASRTIPGSSPAGRRAAPPTLCWTTSPKTFLMIIDESHVTLPQVRGMYARRPGPQRDAGRLRLPPALRFRQPAFEF